MKLDDLARAAAAEVRRAADESKTTDPVRFRQRRQNRMNVVAVGGAVVALVTVLTLITVAPPQQKSAVAITTVPSIPSLTTSTIGVDTRPSVRIVEREASDPLGAGWEEIDAGPVAGRYRMAAAWTDYGLFVYGGHDNYSQESPSVNLYYHDGYLYDPDTGWSALPEVGQELFEVGEPQALAIGDAVLVYGRPRAPLSNHAGVYDLVTQHWEQVPPEFGNELGPGTILVWTGDLVVAPTLGLAYDPEDGQVSVIPVVPSDADVAVHSAQRAHWTGSEVVVIGSGPAYAWFPGYATWREFPAPPVPDRARDSVWADGRLWVFNYEMAAAVLSMGPAWNPETGTEAGSWTRPGDLPLRFYECLPDALAAGDTPVVRMCSGIALWDEVDWSWYPVPLEDLGLGRGGWSDLVGADDAIYSLGGSTLRRFRIVRDETGSIILPHTIPIGVMQLKIPAGWDVVSSFAPEQPADGTIPDDETIGLVFESGDTTCRVASTYTGIGWTPPPDAALIGDIALGPSGELSAAAYAVDGLEDDEWGILYSVPDPNGSDWVTIRCSSPDRDSLTASAASFAYLWSPWDPPTESPEVTAGPGWESLDAGPVAGRMRIAAAWTGTEIFVWGGHDGYHQETPGPEAFHQDAYLFDPTTGTWRPAAPPPDDLCEFTEANAMRLDDEVLLRGLAPNRDDCAQAAIYSPTDDEWQVIVSPLFDSIYFRSDLVWTGEWLVGPTAGLAWVPPVQTIELPAIRGGDFGASRVTAHWTGDRIIAVGEGDAYTLIPGGDSWASIPGPPILENGRVSVWSSEGLWTAEPDHGAALLDGSLIDQSPRWYYSSLPLRNDECAVELLLAGDRPVAATCVGLAIWDDFWVPIPAAETGWAWQPTLVGSDAAIYSIGESFHRLPIAVDSEGGLADPSSILVGQAFLDLGKFRISRTIGLSRVEYPDGSIGEAIMVMLEGPDGRCRVTSTYQGPPLGEPERVFAPSGFLVLVFASADGMTDWAIRTGDGDVVRIHCESEDDALTLVHGVWNISYPQT